MISNKWLSKLSKKMLFGTLGLALLGGGVLTNGVKASAKNIDKVETINENSYAPSKYNVVASFNKDTTIETFGSSEWKVRTNSNGYKGQTLNHPSDSLKGKIGVIYHNIGMNNGKVLSLKITVEDWEKYNTVNAEKMVVLQS